jgi:hypothetical protein
LAFFFYFLFYLTRLIYVTFSVVIIYPKPYIDFIEILKTENIKGYFVTYQAPDGKPNQFATDLENLFLFDNKKQFRGIPIYAIVDKQGTLITNDAKRPSSGEELKKQLQETNNSHN